MSLALKPSAFAARSTPHVWAILLRLIPTVLAADPSAATDANTAAASHHQKPRSRGRSVLIVSEAKPAAARPHGQAPGRRVEILQLQLRRRLRRRRRLLPELESLVCDFLISVEEPALRIDFGGGVGFLIGGGGAGGGAAAS